MFLLRSRQKCGHIHQRYQRNIKTIAEPDETGDFIGEVRYLGEETPRAYGHEYSMETFEAGETKSYPLIFFMPDEMVKNEELYLEINATGIAYDTSDAEFSVMRYIILN